MNPLTKKISRREFVRDSAQAAVGVGLALSSTHALAADPQPRSRVVQVTHPTVVSTQRAVDEAAVRQMIRSGVQALTGDPRGLAQLFAPQDRVGLKINCLGGRRLFTHHELVDAFAAELQAAGVKPDNIVVWDRFEDHMTSCKYVLKPAGPGVRCYGSESRSSDVARFDAKAAYLHAGGAKADRSRISSIFTRDCDKIINLAILKDHGSAGVTLALKNIAFGICDNNRGFHGRDAIGPFIADVCAREDVRKKFVLHAIDGIEGCFDGGPRPDSEDQLFQPRMLWLGKDPVALDTIGAAVIEAERKQRGLPTLAADGRSPDHIRLAAAKGIGTDDRARIELVEVKAG